MIKMLAGIFPVLLFLFKYLLPALAEAIIPDKEFNMEQIKLELLQFPVDIMFVAISYVIPKVIEILNTAGKAKAALLVTVQGKILQEVIIYFVMCIIMLFLLPFLVFLSKLCVKWYYQEKKRKRNILVLILYIISFGCVAISLFIY